jgi:hypothetical protein
MTKIGSDVHKIAQSGCQQPLAVSARLRAARQRHRSGPVGAHELPPPPASGAGMVTFWRNSATAIGGRHSDLSDRSHSPAFVPDRVEEQQ